MGYTLVNNTWTLRSGNYSREADQDLYQAGSSIDLGYDGILLP